MKINNNFELGQPIYCRRNGHYYIFCGREVTKYSRQLLLINEEQAKIKEMEGINEFVNVVDHSSGAKIRGTLMRMLETYGCYAGKLNVDAMDAELLYTASIVLTTLAEAEMKMEVEDAIYIKQKRQER